MESGMSRLSSLRNRSSQLNDAIMKEKAERVRTAVKAVVDSDAFNLSVMDLTASSENTSKLVPEAAETIVSNITTEVCKTVLNPVNDFMDICHARGMKDLDIVRAVESINKVWKFVDSDVYEEQLKAVAEYMGEHRSLYDQLGTFDVPK